MTPEQRANKTLFDRIEPNARQPDATYTMPDTFEAIAWNDLVARYRAEDAADVAALSPTAIEVLGQLYTRGPIWDGNICSKVGRGELVRAGLAHHQHGYAFLTPEGVRVVSEWSIADLRSRQETQWIEKRRAS